MQFTAISAFPRLRFCSRSSRRAERVLISSLATELRALPDLSERVVALADAPRRQRTDTLLEQASRFRGEWATLGAADALKRMATNPALYDAVTRELRTA